MFRNFFIVTTILLSISISATATAKNYQRSGNLSITPNMVEGMKYGAEKVKPRIRKIPKIGKRIVSNPSNEIGSFDSGEYGKVMASGSGCFHLDRYNTGALFENPEDFLESIAHADETHQIYNKGTTYSIESEIFVSDRFDLDDVEVFKDSCKNDEILQEHFCYEVKDFYGRTVSMKGMQHVNCAPGAICQKGKCVSNNPGNPTLCTPIYDEDIVVGATYSPGDGTESQDYYTGCVDSDGNGENDAIDEWRCVSDYDIASNRILCEEDEICVNSECVERPQETTCEELDLIDHLHDNSGVMISEGDSQSIQIRDVCLDDTTVLDQHCDDNRRAMMPNQLVCLEGEVCRGGACVAMFTCGDSDNGLAYRDFGEVTTTESEIPIPDQCAPDNPNILYEQYCDEDGIQRTISFDCSTLETDPDGVQTYECRSGECIRAYNSPTCPYDPEVDLERVYKFYPQSGLGNNIQVKTLGSRWVDTRHVESLFEDFPDNEMEYLIHDFNRDGYKDIFLYQLRRSSLEEDDNRNDYVLYNNDYLGFRNQEVVQISWMSDINYSKIKLHDMNGDNFKEMIIESSGTYRIIDGTTANLLDGTAEPIIIEDDSSNDANFGFADFNQDGLEDIYEWNGNRGYTTRYNNEDPSSIFSMNWSHSFAVSHAFATDLNDDNYPELLLIDKPQYGVDAPLMDDGFNISYRMTEGVSFMSSNTPRTDFHIPSSYLDFPSDARVYHRWEMKDMNRDGLDDLVALIWLDSGSFPKLYVWLQNPAGSETPFSEMPSTVVDMADLIDLDSTEYDPLFVCITRGWMSGAGTDGISWQIADLNGDGVLDYLFDDYCNGGLWFLFNSSDGLFTGSEMKYLNTGEVLRLEEIILEGVSLPPIVRPYPDHMMTTEDINHDGCADITFTSNSSVNLWLTLIESPDR